MGNALSFLDQSYDVHLLVEDWRTYYYLDRLFPTLPMKLQLIPVGGCGGVASLAATSWQKSAQSPVHAFGLRDRDFGHDNLALWTDRNTHVFCLDVHEIENFLLVWDALAQCQQAFGCGKTSAEFRGICLAKAWDMLYDVACSDVIYQLQSQYGDRFPKQPQNRKPKVHLSSIEDARIFLTGDAWFKGRESFCAELFKGERMVERLEDSVRRFQASLTSASDDWKRIFPGKEVFESAMQTVFHGDVNNEDMVKSIGEYQYANHRLPQALTRLMNELYRRKTLGWV